MDIKSIINNIYPLPESSFQNLVANITEIRMPKGSRILKAGVTESDIFFVAHGIVRAYIPTEERDITFWIGAEGSTVISLKSYVNNEPGYETVECMENTLLYVLKRSVLEKLFLQDIYIANWGRKFAETEFLLAEEKFIPLLFTTATKRYERLLKKQAYLFHRIPLEHLASYLGITPVSLSRIRAKISKNQKGKDEW